MKNCVNRLACFSSFFKIAPVVGVASLCLLVTGITNPGISQTTESLAVATQAPDTPDWLRRAVQADDFVEDAGSTAIETLEYAQAAAGRFRTSAPTYTQPAGALTGKVVYAMAGHGWTYDSDKMYYYTQRGLSHGMIEDMGNADQMHIFAHLLHNTGATVVPLRPVDYQPNERVLDNMMPQVELFGAWKRGSAAEFFGPADAEVPYAVAPASLEESAVARFRPYIPEEGYYPVYVWARDGKDRSNQLYRIAHSGGMAEMRVNWRTVGKTWVWLGTYHFEQGNAGYVETTNQVIDPYEAYQGHVVLADAVRFGNGRGDVQRPGGISGYSREDEGDSYWIEQSLGNNADRRLFDVGRDGSSTISSPPKAAAYTNREVEGSFFDRVLISFHSNASSGKARGAVALFNASADKRPSHQESFAEILGHEVNRQMSEDAPPSGQKWAPRQRNTYSGINFGELRRDYLHNEMVATIVETAFHDNEADVEFLLNPDSRIQMAQATLRGLFRWYSEVVYSKTAYALPPARPIAVAAEAVDGKISVKWATGTSGEFSGGPATQIRVYRSSNGYGFDGGVTAAANADSQVVDPLTTSGPTFIRVTALNGSGESFPSQTVAVYAGDPASRQSRQKPPNLILSPVTMLDRTVNVPYKLDHQAGGPFRAGAQTQRVRAVYALLEPYGVEEAKALAALGERFNGADTAALEAKLVELKGYRRVFFPAETHNPSSALVSNNVEQAMRAFVNSDGRLYFSGSGLAQNLIAQGDGQAEFLRNFVGVFDPEPANAGAVVRSENDRFLPTTHTITLAQSASFWMEDEVQPVRFIPHKDRSINLLRFDNASNSNSAALLTRPTRAEGEVVYLGFPLSLVADQRDRVLLMEAILKQL